LSRNNSGGAALTGTGPATIEGTWQLAQFDDLCADPEYQARAGEDSYCWDGEAWYGGDVNRLVVKSEAEGGFDEGVDRAEFQTLYSRAAGLYTDVQCRSAAGYRAACPHL
jgi:uncharacterized protein involved in copper resistance